MSNSHTKVSSTDKNARTDDNSTKDKSKTDKVDRGGAKVGDMNGEAKKAKR